MSKNSGKNAKRMLAALLAFAMVTEPAAGSLPGLTAVYADETVLEKAEMQTAAAETPAAAASETSAVTAAPSGAEAVTVQNDAQTASPGTETGTIPETSDNKATEETTSAESNIDAGAVVVSVENRAEASEAAETEPEASSEVPEAAEKEESEAEKTAKTVLGTSMIKTEETTEDPEAEAEETAEAVPEESAEEIPEAVPEESAEETPEAAAESPAEETPEAAAQESAEESPETAPEAAPEVTPEVTPQADPEATPAEAVQGTEESTEEPISETDASAEENVDVEEEPILLAAENTMVTSAGAAGDSSVTTTVSILQNMIDKAIAAEKSLSKMVEIVLDKNAVYEGDVTISVGNRSVGAGFELKLSSADAGEDGVSGDGYTSVNGNIVIKGIKVTMNSVMMGGEKMITVKEAGPEALDDPKRGGTLIYNGTRDFMNEFSVTVGTNSSAELYTSDDDDTINVTAQTGAKSVIVDSGDGLNFINATVAGGDMTIFSGSGTDSLSLDIEAGAGNVYADTGAGADQLEIIDNGAAKSAVINAGAGDDIIDIDVRAEAGDMTVNTGTGGDTIMVTKGDAHTMETLDYAKYYNPIETYNDAATSVVTINNQLETRIRVKKDAKDKNKYFDLLGQAVDVKNLEVKEIGGVLYAIGHQEGDAVDRALVDLCSSDAIKGIAFKHGKGTSVHLRGDLLDNSKDGNHNITGNAEKLVLTGDHENTLEIYGDKNTNYTDTLDNKYTVVVDEFVPEGTVDFVYNGAVSAFTDYVFSRPVSGYKSITVTGGSGPLLLSNLVLDSRQSMDSDDHIIVNDLTAANLNVLLKGREIDVNGTVEAQNVRAEAVRGTEVITEDMDLLEPGKAFETLSSIDMLSVVDKTKINVNKGADIKAVKDIALISRVKHTGGIFTLLPAFINLLNFKYAEAHVYVNDGAKLTAKGGSVDLQAKIETTTGYDYNYDEEPEGETSKDGMPVAVTIILDDASVEIRNGASVTAGEDVLLNSQGIINTMTNADGGTYSTAAIGAEIDIAVTVISNKVKSLLGGTVSAGRKVRVFAEGNVSDETEAARAKKAGALSGVFAAVNIVNQDVSAKIQSGANVTAGEDVKIDSSAIVKVKTSALAAAGKKTEDHSAAKSVLSLVAKVIGLVIEKYSDQPAVEEVFRQLKRRVMESSYSVKIINPSAENDAKGASTFTKEVTDDGIKVTVTVRPKAGCAVQSVRIRYLKPGEDHYTYETVAVNNGRYVFTMPNANVEIVVNYSGEPHGGDDQEEVDQEEDDQNGNGEGDFSFADLFDDAQENAQNNVEEEEDLYQFDAERYAGRNAHAFSFSTEMKNGKVVTWLTKEDLTSLDRVYATQKVLLVPNPDEGKEVKKLTVSYRYKEGMIEKLKSETVTADSQGRYIYTVPTTLPDDVPLIVMAEFKDKEQEISHTQVTGSVAFDWVTNNNEALIEAGSTVTAGGLVDLIGRKRTARTTTADGTEITEKYTAEDKEKKPEYTTHTKFTVTGAQYAVKINSTVPDAVTATMELAEGASAYHPKFTVKKEYADSIDKVYISYYTKANTSLTGGKRVTQELKKQVGADGTVYYQPGFTSNAVVNGSVLQVNFFFKEGTKKSTEESTGQSTSDYLVRNPIAITLNQLVEKDADGKSVGKDIGAVAYVKTEKQNNGKTRYYFNVIPYAQTGYTINAQGSNYQIDHKSNTKALCATWRGTDGSVKKAPLVYDGAYWYYETGGGNFSVPAGNLITIYAEFTEDVHELTAEKQRDSSGTWLDYGNVTFSKSAAKAKDDVTITMVPKDGYFAKKVTLSWQEPTDNGITFTQKTAEYTPDGSGKIKIKMPQLTEKTNLLVTPTFVKKTVSLYATGTADTTSEGNVTLSETGKAAAGQKITVSASESAAKKGYKVTWIELKFNGKTTGYQGDSFVVPDGVENGQIEIRAEMKKKEIGLTGYTDPQGLGKIEFVCGCADPGDTVMVKIKPKDGYRIKYGTLKADITTSTSSYQIVLSREGENKYSFVMPDGEEITSSTRVSISGEFEQGSDGVEISAGVSAAVGVTQAENHVEIQGGNVTAGKGISMKAVSIGGKAFTEAKAGFSQGKKGFAGALAVQVASITTDSAIKVDEKGSITVKNGGLSMMAKGKQDFKVTGDATGKKGSKAEKTGVGAGIALAIDNLSTTVEVEEGVKLGGKLQGKDGEQTGDTNLTFVNLNAGQKAKDIVTANAGAAGGNAGAAALAVDVISVKSLSKLGKLRNVPNGVLDVEGKVKIKSSSASAKAAYNHDVSADASARTGKPDGTVGGASAIVTWINNTSSALLNQSVNAAKDVEVNSAAGDAVKAIATAAVTGGFEGSTDKNGRGTADRQADRYLTGAGGMAGRYGGMNGNRIQNDVKGRQQAETTEGGSAGAGAFVLNVQKNLSNAKVLNGVDVTTKGKLTVKSGNRTDGTIRADASATKSNIGVGVGIALNIVKMENIATIGNGKVTASALEVIAEIAKAPTVLKKRTVVENVSSFRTQLEARLVEGIKKLLEEYGLSSVAGEISGKAAAAGAAKIVEDLKLDKLFAAAGDSTGELFAGPAEILWQNLKGFPLALSEPLITILKQFSDTFSNWDSARVQRVAEDVGQQILVQAAGNAFEITRNILKESSSELASSAVDILTRALGGDGWNTEEIEKILKNSFVKEFKEQFMNKFLENFLAQVGAELPIVSENNVEIYKQLKELEQQFSEKGVKEVLAVKFADYFLKVFREQVYDYQVLAAEVQKKGGFKDFMKATLTDALKQAQVTLVNESIDSIIGGLDKIGDVVLTKENIQNQHTFTTQAISGAGAAYRSGAGSLAIAVLNLDTRAEIGSSDKTVTVENDGALKIDAEEVRRVRTEATAAVDADGDPDSKNGSGSGEDADTGGSSKAHITTTLEGENYKYVLSSNTFGTAVIARESSENNPVIKLVPHKGYKLTEGALVERSFTYGDNYEDVNNVKVHYDPQVGYYILAYEGAALEEIQNATLNFSNIVFEEDLHEIAVPTARARHNEEEAGNALQEGMVTVGVAGRKVENNTLKAMYGDIVEVTCKKQAGINVSMIRYTYQEDGVAVSKEVSLQNERISDNANESVYAISMPASKIDSIEVRYSYLDAAQQQEQGQAAQNEAKDAAGRSVGVGAAFAVTYGKSEANALIGARGKASEYGVTAGSVSITASNTHNNEKNYATAGTDPFIESDPTLEKDLAVDAAVAFNLLDNTVKAGIAAGTNVKTTNASSNEAASYEGVVVRATEAGNTETKTNAFATGSTTIVGATVAVNIALSDIKAEAGGKIDSAGDVVVEAVSKTADETWAFASALGGDIQRALNKFAKGVETTEKTANKLTHGSYFDEEAKKENKKASKNKTASRINDRLNQNQAAGGDAANNNLPASANVLRSQGVQAQNGEEANAPVQQAQQNVNENGGQNIEEQQDPNGKEKLQVAASVGFTWAQHESHVTVGDLITAGARVKMSADTTGNLYTRSTAAAISAEMKPDGGKTIAAAVGAGVNKNKAIVEVTGGINAKNDVDVTATMSQNVTEGYKGKLAVQALSGAGSGSNTDYSIAGSIGVLISNAETRAEVNGGKGSTEWGIKGENVRISAVDTTKLGLRTGGINVTKGSSIGAGIASGLILSENTVKASVGDNAKVRAAASFSLDAKKVPVSWDDLESPFKLSDLISDSSKLDDEGRKYVKTGIIDVHRKTGEQSYTVDVNVDSYRIMKVFDLLNFLAFKNYYVEAVSGGISTGNNGLNASGSLAIVKAKNTVEAILGKNVSVTGKEESGNKITETKNTGSVDITADGTSNIRLIGGALTGGKASTNLGVTVTYFGDSDDIKTTVGDNAEIKADKVSVKGKADMSAESYNAAANISTGSEADKDIGGIIAVLDMKNTVNNTIGKNASITSAKGLDITAEADNDLMLISAGLAAAGHAVAAGGTLAVISDNTESIVTIGDDHVLKAGDDVNISAKTTDKLLSAAVAVSAAKSKTGAGTLNVMSSGTKGNVSLGKGGEGKGITSDAGSISLQGITESRSINVTVGAAGSKEAAVGLSVNGTGYDRESKVQITGGAGYKISAGKDVRSEAFGRDTTVMAGLALTASIGSGGYSGNLQIARSANTIMNTLGEGTVTAGAEAAFSSRLVDHTYDVAGSIGFGKESGAVGAAAVMLFKDNTILTDLGKSDVTADGNAGTLSAQLNGKPAFKGVYVGATSEDTNVTVSAGVALSGATGLSANLAILRNKNSIKANTENARITASTGEIIHTALADTLSWVVAGGLNIGKSNGAGGSGVGIYSTKDVNSLAGSLTAAESVKVNAENKDEINMLAVSGGGGKNIAVQIGAVIQKLGSHVHAKALKDISSLNNGVSVTADNTTNLVNVAVAIAGSGDVAVSPVGAVMLFDGETEACALAKVTASGNVRISADAGKNINQYSIGFAVPVKGSGVSGAVNIIKAEDTIHAYTGKNAEISNKGGSLSIDASGKYEAVALSGAAALGAQATGAVNAMLHILESRVEAELNGKADAGNVSVRAEADRDVLDLAITAGYGGVVTVGATVMYLGTGKEKISQDVFDTLTYGNSKKKADTGTADKTFAWDEFAGAASAQGIDTASVSSVKKNMEGDGRRISEEKGDGSADNKQTSAADLKDMVVARITSGTEVTASGDVTVRAVQPSKADLYGINVAFSGEGAVGASVAVAELHSNVAASSMGNIHMDNGSLTVDASSSASDVDVSKDQSENERMQALISNTKVAENASKESGKKVDNALNPGKRSIRAVGAGVAGAGAAAINVAVGAVMTDNVTEALLGGTVENPKEVKAHADSVYDNITAVTVGIGVSAAGELNASVAVAKSEGAVSAKITEGASVIGKKTAPALDVTTNSKMHATTVATGIAGGSGGANVGVSYAVNNMTQNTLIDGGVQIRGTAAAAKVNVAADSETQTDTFLLVLGANLYGTVQAGISSAYVKPVITTAVGKAGAGTTVLNLRGADVTVANKVRSWTGAGAVSLSGTLGVGIVGVGLRAVNESDVTAEVKNVNLTSNTLKVSSASKALGDTSVSEVHFGSVGTASLLSKVDLNAVNKALVDSTGGNIYAKNGITIDTGDKDTSKSEATAATFALDVAGIEVSSHEGTALNRTTNYAGLLGSGAIRTDTGKIDVSAYSDAKASVETRYIGLAGLSIKMLHNPEVPLSLADNKAVSKVEVRLTEALTGDLKVRSDMKAETTAGMANGGLEIVRIAAVNSKALGDTRSLIDVSLAKGGTKEVGIDVQNHASDTVTADLNDSYPEGGISVVFLKATAESKDIADTKVDLGSGDYTLSSLNVLTDAAVKVKADMDAGTTGASIGALTGQNNDARAENTSNSAAALKLGGKVKVSGDVNVNTAGSMEADARAGVARVAVQVLGSFGPTDAVSNLAANQAATLDVNSGTLEAGGNLNVTSTYSKASASADVGVLSGDKDTDYSFLLGLLPVTPYTADATQTMSSTAGIKGSGADTSRIIAKNLTLKSGSQEDVTSEAKAVTKGTIEVALMAIGDMEAKSLAKESVYTTVDGVTIDTDEKADIAAKVNSVSEAKGLAPYFNLTIGSDFRDLDAKAETGSDSERQTAKVLIGDGTVIRSEKDLTVSAFNEGHAQTDLHKGSLDLVASTLDYEQHTNEWYETGVSVGRNAVLKSGAAAKILSETAPGAVSDVTAWDAVLFSNTSDALGNSSIDEKNEISIGDNTEISAAEDLDVKASTSAKSVAKANYTNVSFLSGIDKAQVHNNVKRDVIVTVGRASALKSADGSVNVNSVSGESDNIVAEGKANSVVALFAVGRAYAIANLNSNNVVRVGENAEISAKKDVNLLAKATSKGSDGKADGTDLNSEVKGGAAISVPVTESRLTTNLNSNVYVNRGRSSGKTRITSQEGNVNLLATNEGLKFHLRSNADTTTVGGGADATAEITGNIYNEVWVDNAEINAGREVVFKAHNNEAETGRIYAETLAEVYGLGGKTTSSALMNSAVLKNYVSSYDTGKVQVTGKFTHLTKSPASDLGITLKAETNGAGLVFDSPTEGYGYRDKMADHCDFCTQSDHSGQETEVRTLDVVDGVISDQRIYDKAAADLKAAFEKALLPLNEIGKVVDAANKQFISKAGYDEEETRQAEKLFAMDVQSILLKDARIDKNGLGRYLLWSNTVTQMDLYLLPNSSRLYIAAGGSIQYVTETLRGDALGDGNVHDIDIITALSGYAFAYPVIPIGNKGSLNFSDGTLLIPGRSDMDLYLHEISSEWLLGRMNENLIRTLSSDQDEINAFVLAGGELPEGDCIEGVTSKGTVLRSSGSKEEGEDWQFYWAGKTPDTAENDDTPLYYLLVNEKTDEVDAFRTSRAMMEKNEDPVDVSVLLYRDSKSDRMGEEKYNMLFFDTPENEQSLVRVFTDVVEDRMLEVPKPLRIVLRQFSLNGADLPAFGISGHLFAMNDGSDGKVSMFGGFYEAVFDGDVFESDYLRIKGIADRNLTFIIKEGQPVWPEMNGDGTATDPDGFTFVRKDGEWVLMEEETESSTGGELAA